MLVCNAMSAFRAGVWLIVAMGVAGCGTAEERTTTAATPSAARPAQTVRIALDYTANVNYLGIYAAVAEGYFARQGVRPEILPYSNTSAEVLIKNGKTDLGISYPPAIIDERARGLEYKAVAALVSHNTTAIAVKADSPVTGPAQLSGKTNGGFGIPSDAAILKAIMRADGAADPAYKEVVLNTSAYVALAKGRVDYAVVFQGIDDVTAALQGARLKTFPYRRYLGAAGDYPSTVFVAGDDVIARKGDALKRALRALAQGYTFAARHPAEAERLLIDQNRAALGSSQAIVRATGDATAKDFLDPSGAWGRLVESDFSGLSRILGQAGVVHGTPPPPAELYTDALLPAG